MPSNTKKVTIQMPKNDVELIKEIIRLEERNVEAHRMVRKESQKTEYEKRLRKLSEQFTSA